MKKSACESALLNPKQSRDRRCSLKNFAVSRCNLTCLMNPVRYFVRLEARIKRISLHMKFDLGSNEHEAKALLFKLYRCHTSAVNTCLSLLMPSSCKRRVQWRRVSLQVDTEFSKKIHTCLSSDCGTRKPLEEVSFLLKGH